MLEQLDGCAGVALAEQVSVRGFSLGDGRQKQGPFLLAPTHQPGQHFPVAPCPHSQGVHHQTGTILVTSHSGVRLDAPDAVLCEPPAQEVQPVLEELDVIAPVALAEQVSVGGFGLCYGRQKQGPFFLPPPYQASQHLAVALRPHGQGVRRTGVVAGIQLAHRGGASHSTNAHVICKAHQGIKLVLVQRHLDRLGHRILVGLDAVVTQPGVRLRFGGSHAPAHPLAVVASSLAITDCPHTIQLVRRFQQTAFKALDHGQALFADFHPFVHSSFLHRPSWLALSFSASNARSKTAGSGTPIKPAFSAMLMTSLTVKAMHTPSRT